MTNPRIIFFLPEYVHLLDLAGPMQVFQEAAGYGQHYEILWCSRKPDILSSVGLGLFSSTSFENIQPQKDDYVVVPGIDSEKIDSAVFAKDARLQKWLRYAYKRGAHLCSVCGGAFAFGYAGLLDGRRCTTHWRLTEKLQHTFPKTRVESDVLFVEDERILTSAGISAGIDVALHILEQRHGALLAHNVARELVVYHRRSSLHTQSSVYLDYRNHVHPGIHKVQDWIVDNLRTAPTLETLAEIAMISVRHLTRLFRQTTGISINDYITLIRRETAQTLANNPEYTAERIAEECGLTSVRHLRRILAG